MSQIEPKKRTKREKKKLSRSALVLIISILIIAVPVIIFLAILGISALQTGTPREGSRFDNDLKPTITSSMVDSLESDLKTISSVEDVEVVLSQGQLRIYIDTVDSLSDEQFDSIVTSAYGKVNSAIPVSTYFTSTDSSKMYDLAINVYTKLQASDLEADSSRKYKLLHKNSTEQNYEIEDLANPRNKELATQLQGNNEITTEEDVEDNTESESSND